MNVGVDLVSTDEVREAMQIHGDRYLNRVYTDREQHDCGRDPRRLAGCFAAKEAAMKALRRGDEALPWRSIGVQRHADGTVALELSSEAAELAARRGIGELHLSMTYNRAAVAAIVVADGQGAI
jgi:holo-[acyl-carrier protein] synthase